MDNGEFISPQIKGKLDRIVLAKLFFGKLEFGPFLMIESSFV